MARYASGKRAWGECARSGRRVKLNSMVRDGYRPRILVAPEDYDPEEPQEHSIPNRDAAGLLNPAPDNERIPHTITWPIYDISSDATLTSLRENEYIGNIVYSIDTAETMWVSSDGDTIISSDGSVLIFNG